MCLYILKELVKEAFIKIFLHLTTWSLEHKILIKCFACFIFGTLAISIILLTLKMRKTEIFTTETPVWYLHILCISQVEKWIGYSAGLFHGFLRNEQVKFRAAPPILRTCVLLHYPLLYGHFYFHFLFLFLRLEILEHAKTT